MFLGFRNGGELAFVFDELYFSRKIVGYRDKL